MDILNKIKEKTSRIDKRPFYVVLAIIFVFLAIYYFPFFFGVKPKSIIDASNPIDEYIEINEQVLAKSAIIYDIDNEDIIMGKNLNTLLPIASIAKLIPAIIAYNRLDDSDISKITQEDYKLFGNTNLVLGDEWVSRDLLKYSLIESSNRGVNSVARTVSEKTSTEFYKLAKEFIKTNQLNETYILNASGLDIHEGLPSTESSAVDIAKLLKIFIDTTPELALATIEKERQFTSIRSRRYTATNTNKDIDIDILASKTGYTDKSGGNLAVVVQYNDSRYALVVLGSTRTGRFKDIKTLREMLSQF